MARYLVTGGCGFIGSHLVDSLVADGHAVTVLDDLSTGKRENLPAGMRLIIADVADPAVVKRAMTDADGCFHLAAIASVQRSQEDWIGCHRTNLGGTLAVLDAARKRRTPVVYASSAAVYGATDRLPITEETPMAPLTAYGADKLASELQAAVASQCFGVPTIGLRFFNVYGPRQDPRSPYSGVISIFSDRMRAGLPVTVFGDGSQVRDFVHVADVVRHLRAAMDRIDLEPRVFNVCTGRPTSINDLVRTLAALTGSHSPVLRGPARVGDIRRSLGAPGKAIRTLGITAGTPLETGLATLLAEPAATRQPAAA